MGTEAARARRGRNPVFRASSAVPVWGAMLVSSGIFCATQTFAWDQAAWVALVTVLLAAIPRHVEVGAEGVRIAWLGAGRLVRYEDVRRAEPLGGDDVALTFTSGETLRLVRGGSDGACPRDVLERLWQTLAQGAEDGPRPNERAALARGSRSVEEWLADLRRLATPGTQYRQGLVTLDRLLSIATNPGVEIEIRGAAAVACALGGALDEARRDELRAIASLTVDEALREAFLRVAEASVESDLCAALREIA